MENTHRYLPERKNRGNRMSELAKDEGKMLEDDKYGIFKEDSSDDDFNPDDVKNVVYSSSAEEGEGDEEGEGEGEEYEDSNDDIGENESENLKKQSPKKKNKNEEEILDIDQLDIDKIDMIEDLKERGIDISDEEELEKRMREYNEESEIEEEPKVVKIPKKRGRKSKKELEMMHKKRGRKKKVVEKDDNIFLSNQNKPEVKEKAPVEINCNKIIIDNTDNDNENGIDNANDYNSELKDNDDTKNRHNRTPKKKSKKDKLKKSLDYSPSNFNHLFNPNIVVDDKNFTVIIKKKFLTEPLLLSNNPINLDCIELNSNFQASLSPYKNNIKKYKSKSLSVLEKSKINNENIIEISNNNIIISKKIKYKNNDSSFADEVSSSNEYNNNKDMVGHKRTRHENNLIDLFKKQKKEKPNKNVTVVGNRENPKYIYISKKIYTENDEERERKEEKKKKKKEKEKEKEEDKEKENERINFDLKQEIDTKNIIMKYKQQERDKKLFGIQDKVISQEQRLLESIFTELTNKQSLKTMQKLEDLNKREILYTSKKAFKDYVKITNSERHIIEEKVNEQKINNENKTNENINTNNISNNIATSAINNNDKKDEIKDNEKSIKNNDDNKDNKDNKENKVNEENKAIEENKDIQKADEVKEKINDEIGDENKDDNKKLIEEYKEKEKKLNKVRVTFTNKDYFRNLFNNLNKKPIKDKKEKLCAITGKPAKYFDPLTKNYYSTIDAFKILRERYYQKEEDCLLFKIQTLSDLASQKKERLKKMIMSESDKPKEQVEYVFNNNGSNALPNKNNNSIKIHSETLSIEEGEENNSGNKLMSSNSALLKMINKFGLLKNDGISEDKKVINHRIYNRNRENCVESGMLLEANKVKLIISKKIFKDKYSSKLPASEMGSE